MKPILKKSIIFFLVILLLLDPIFQYVKSVLVMKTYSLINEKNSFIRDYGIDS